MFFFQVDTDLGQREMFFPPPLEPRETRHTEKNMTDFEDSNLSIFSLSLSVFTLQGRAGKNSRGKNKRETSAHTKICHLWEIEEIFDIFKYLRDISFFFSFVGHFRNNNKKTKLS